VTKEYEGLLSGFLEKRRIDVARPHLGGRVLDVGCAAGPLAGVIPPDRYVGTDNDEKALAEARSLHPLHDFRTPDEIKPSEEFATVAALAIIEHISNPADWLGDVAQHLAPGGRIVLTTPHARWEHLHAVGARFRLTSSEAHDQHDSLFDRELLRTTLDAAGLQLAYYKRFLAGMNQLAVGVR
jgi:2-polyprenyl-6-hydroxyphenyl methylase/3-demethylubiquinone-9 3-methyltransferase